MFLKNLFIQILCGIVSLYFSTQVHVRICYAASSAGELSLRLPLGNALLLEPAIFSLSFGL